MPFFGTVAERVFWKKIQTTETYTNLLNDALWIFFRKTRSVMVPRFGFFFQDSRIRVKPSKICDRSGLRIPYKDNVYDDVRKFPDFDPIFNVLGKLH